MSNTRVRLVLIVSLVLPGVHLAAQEVDLKPRHVIPPGVSCTTAQLEGAAKPDTNPGPPVRPPVQTRPIPKPRLAILPTGPDETVLLFVVDTTGAVDPCSVRVLRESSRLWTESVVEALLQSRFAPATLQGRPIRFVTRFRYTTH